MRQAGAPLPYAYVVSPAGLVKKLNYHVNVGHIVKSSHSKRGDGTIRLGQPYIDDAYRRQGWTFLEDLYKQDPNPEIRERGFELFQKHAKQLERRAHGSRESKKMDNGKTSRLFAKPFPEEWLPEEVHKRRAGQSEIGGEVFDMPAPPKKSDGKASKRAGS